MATMCSPNSRPQYGGEDVTGYDPALKLAGMPIASGTISLQGESHPIDFRKVELLNLRGCTGPEASSYKSHYVESDPAACF